MGCCPIGLTVLFGNEMFDGADLEMGCKHPNGEEVVTAVDALHDADVPQEEDSGCGIGRGKATHGFVRTNPDCDGLGDKGGLTGA